MLFSATFPKASHELAKAHMADTHVRLRFAEPEALTAIFARISSKSNPAGRARRLWIWSTRVRRREPSFLSIPSTLLRNLTILSTIKSSPAPRCILDVHNMSTRLLCVVFWSGKYPILIATALGSGGLYVRNVLHVIN